MPNTENVERSARAIHRARYTKIDFDNLGPERQEDFRREAAAAVGVMGSTEELTLNNVARAIYTADAAVWGHTMPWDKLTEWEQGMFLAKAESALSCFDLVAA